MQHSTQEQFVADCLSKYRWEPIPSDQKWEAGHYPLPACSGEHDTVMLWSADHTVQGLLQSVEFDHPCFHYKANSKDLYNLETYYPEYLELFQQLKSKFNSRHGKKAAINKTGIHAPKMRGVGGKKAAELGVGAHAPGVSSAAGKKGGKKSGAQRYQCLVTRHISNAGALSNYQKARGIDTSLRIQLFNN